MRPALFSNNPATTERNVVLPQPDGPTIDTNSPSMIFRSTPSSATSRVLVRGWTYSSRMSCASSLAFIMRLLQSGRRAPDIHPVLDPLHDLDQYHPDGDDGEHADEDLVGLEARSRLVDHGADARGRTVDFADHHADHPAADREPQPRQQKRDRARQDDGSKQPPITRAEASGDLDQARIGGANRGVRVDRERQHRKEKDDQDPLAESGADPNDDQWQEGHLRRGVERREERLDCVGQAPVPAAGEPERNANHDRQAKAEDITGAAPGEVGPNFSGYEEHTKGRRCD